jgi:hypothetical protein
MTPLAAVLTCTLHNDAALVRAIVDNAHDNPYSIIDLELDPDQTPTHAPTAPRTLDAAVAALSDLLAQGVAPLVGLMQIPVAWATSFGRVPGDLFDPCINVSIGSAMLSAYDYACAQPKTLVPSRTSAGPRARRGCVLRRYAEAIGMPELETVVALDLRFQHSFPAPPADAPILTPTTDRPTWGANCLLIRSADRK